MIEAISRRGRVECASGDSLRIRCFAHIFILVYVERPDCPGWDYIITNKFGQTLFEGEYSQTQNL